jgi:hypothetical protein
MKKGPKRPSRDLVFGGAPKWSSAMDGKNSALLKDPQPQTPNRAPRLLNAAAWLETLAALEEEFKSILAEKTASSRQAADKRRGS